MTLNHTRHTLLSLICVGEIRETLPLFFGAILSVQLNTILR